MFLREERVFGEIALILWRFSLNWCTEIHQESTYAAARDKNIFLVISWFYDHRLVGIVPDLTIREMSWRRSCFPKRFIYLFLVAMSKEFLVSFWHQAPLFMHIWLIFISWETLWRDTGFLAQFSVWKKILLTSKFSAFFWLVRYL